MTLTTEFILASQSPRRRELLEHVGVDFTVHVSPVEEVVPSGPPPVEIVQELARQKGKPVAQDHPSALTLAADTIVVHEERILTKPHDPAHARQMLRRLSETTHEVMTGIALYHVASNRCITAAETTRVAFGSISDPEIDRYVDTGSPLDKAGGYGIQDHTAPLFIDGIEGDYYNVVGLPLRRLYLTLQSHFGDVLN